MKNKIAFFVQHILCGGVENALITLSDELVKAGHDVTIYVVEKKGDFISRIPQNVRLKKIDLPKNIADILPVGGTKLAAGRKLKECHYIQACIMLMHHALGKSGFAELNVDFDRIPKLEDKYDIAVTYHMHSPFLVRYLAEKVVAARKLMWIHNDFTTTGYDIRRLKQYLDCCEAFYGVSEKLVDEFIEIFPEYQDRIRIMYNIVPVENILCKGEDTAPELDNVPQGCKKILSVGRLEMQKGYDLTIEVCKLLKDNNCKFQWFVLGEGTERKKLESMAKRKGVADYLHFLGLRMNPYPYFKNCDLYVQTSRHEGYVTTVTEANIFKRLIVCTDVSGAREQIQDGKNGYVTSFDALEIKNRILELLDWDEKSFVQAIDFDLIRQKNLEIFEM